MKKITFSLSSVSLLALPLVSQAQLASQQGGGAGFERFLVNVLEFSNNILIPFIIGIGFLVFVFGVFRYFIAGGANDEKKEQGRSLMIYAILGFVLIVVFWGIINLLAGSLFDDNQTRGLQDVPTVGVPAENPNRLQR